MKKNMAFRKNGMKTDNYQGKQLVTTEKKMGYSKLGWKMEKYMQTMKLRTDASSD
jgi:hypothetical protein